MTSPQILALDFDGVLCDGLLEYFETAWRAYCQVFEETLPNPPAGLADRFYPLRPVVESGWEMPLVLRALLGGIADEAILTHWSGMVPACWRRPDSNQGNWERRWIGFGIGGFKQT